MIPAMLNKPQGGQSDWSSFQGTINTKEDYTAWESGGWAEGVEC